MNSKMKTIAKWAIPAAMMAMPLLSLALPITPPGTLEIPTGDSLSLAEVKALIVTIANWLMIVGVLIAVLFLAWGGIRWITAGGNPETAGKARETIKNGIIGLVILFGIGVILKTAAGLISRSFFG